jgi:arsenate reductase-like glutaredoxin family protein
MVTTTKKRAEILKKDGVYFSVINSLCATLKRESIIDIAKKLDDFIKQRWICGEKLWY